MKIILDTNIILISLPRKSSYRPIFDALRNSEFELGVSTEIMLEYEEILSKKTSPTVANNVMKMLVNLGNVFHQEVFYHWNLITADEDDNKYVDCAIAFNADYLVTEDKHFNILRNIDFPELKVIGANTFMEVLKG